MISIADLDRIKEFLPQIKLNSELFNLNPDMVAGFIYQESGARIWSYRFEPMCKLAYKPNEYAKKLNISMDTEVAMQRCSWGLLQIMGFKARELNYTDHLPKLLSPTLGLEYGCHAIKTFQDKYRNPNDMIAAYNAGIPKRSAVDVNKYVNQAYVDGVTGYWAFIEKNRAWQW